MQRASLRSHVAVKHRGLGPVCENHERRHRGEKPFVCEQCGAKFHAAYLLAQHKQSHRTEKRVKAGNSVHAHRLAVHGAALHRCPLCAEKYCCLISDKNTRKHGSSTDLQSTLHLNFRFVEQCVVRNHLTAMAWGMEETGGGMPLNRGDNFEALLLCEPHSIKRISHLTVDGDVMMQVIAFEGAQPPQQMYMSEPPAYGAYGAPPAYGAPAYGGPPQGESKLILCFIAAG
ncbi:hypothetical protein MSG28_014806 [Choristoneura fumiferana]|uniref:Uncharacterized protein n=1 Tax=Choristoneura fumiferana TaxID=7141 RepID=A0ACC0JSR6_CHOFU|nr:hypothetical protein MSG28_014806 [Choristoneura fumiferana]